MVTMTCIGKRIGRLILVIPLNTQLTAPRLTNLQGVDNLLLILRVGITHMKVAMRQTVVAMRPIWEVMGQALNWVPILVVAGGVVDMAVGMDQGLGVEVEVGAPQKIGSLRLPVVEGGGVDRVQGKRGGQGMLLRTVRSNAPRCGRGTKVNYLGGLRPLKRYVPADEIFDYNPLLAFGLIL
jgi:hypothetical protein